MVRCTVRKLTAAAVKIEEVYPASRYVDYLSLLKISGEWRIVNKIYIVEFATAAGGGSLYEITLPVAQ